MQVAPLIRKTKGGGGAPHYTKTPFAVPFIRNPLDWKDAKFRGLLCEIFARVKNVLLHLLDEHSSFSTANGRLFPQAAHSRSIFEINVQFQTVVQKSNKCVPSLHVQ